MTEHSRRVTVVQHLAFEDLGSFSTVFEDAGFSIRYLQAGVDDLGEDIRSAELLVVLGGPIGVYEQTDYPFLRAESAALRDRLQRGRPTLGICLGAQLIAQALDANVYPGGSKEIGWGEMSITAAGRTSVVSRLAGVSVLHWHGDTFDLPADAQTLASTPAYKNQAFQIGKNVLALQFHPEVQARSFERWLIGHTGEIRAAEIDILELRESAAEFGPALERAGQLMLADWLRELEW